MSDQLHATVRRQPLTPIVPAGSSVELRDYLRAMFAWRLIILIAAAAGAALGLVLAKVQTPLYRATTTMAVAQSKIGEAALGGLTAIGFTPLVRNHTTAAEIVKRHKLDQAPYNLTPAAFLERILTVSDVRNTNLLMASIALPDPQLASDVVNDVAAQAVALSHRLNREEAERGRDLIGRHVADLAKRLETSEARLLAYRRESQLELVRTEVFAMLEQHEELPALLASIAAERARMATAQEQLKTNEPVLTLRKSIESDPAAMEATKNAGARSVLDLQLNSEVPNPVYEDLAKRVEESRSQVSGLERQRAQIASGDKKARLTDLYQKEMENARLLRERDLTEEAFKQASVQFENATLQVAARSAELQVIDPGFPPDRPFSPRPLRSMLMWMAIGLAGAAAAAVVAQAAAAPRDPD